MKVIRRIRGSAEPLDPTTRGGRYAALAHAGYQPPCIWLQLAAEGLCGSLTTPCRGAYVSKNHKTGETGVIRCPAPWHDGTEEPYSSDLEMLAAQNQRAAAARVRRAAERAETRRQEALLNDEDPDAAPLAPRPRKDRPVPTGPLPEATGTLAQAATCKHGHDLTSDFTRPSGVTIPMRIVSPKNGITTCAACKQAATDRFLAKKAGGQ